MPQPPFAASSDPGPLNNQDLTNFIRGSFRSVWALELLLFLWRNPGRRWRAEELVKELRASQFVVLEGVRSLQTVGLVMSDGDQLYSYAPANPALDDLVRRLDALYRERPFAVTREIFAAPNEKLRTLADAFKLKKDG
jgi:hypothetical protein